MTSPCQTPCLFLLCDDLLFASRIVAQAARHGVQCLRAATVQEWDNLMGLARPELVILDLALAGPAVRQLVGSIRQAWPTPPRIVAYGPHVHADLLHEARQMGCDIVLPRSKFVQELPVQLQTWLGRG